MPVWKYRRVEDMPEAWQTKRRVPLGRRIRAVLGMARLAPPLDVPRGVRKFRSFEELTADRRRYETRRIARILAGRDDE